MFRSFLRILVRKAWIFFSINKQGPCLSAIEENGDDTRLTQLELAFEVMVLLHRILFNLANAA